MDEQLARRPSFSQLMDEQLAHRPSFSEAIDERMGRQAAMHQATPHAGLGGGKSDRTIGASEKEGYAMLQERSDAGDGVGAYGGGRVERSYDSAGAGGDQWQFAGGANGREVGAAYGDDRSYGGHWQGDGRVADHHNARGGLFGQQDAGNSFEMEDAKIDTAWMQIQAVRHKEKRPEKTAN